MNRDPTLLVVERQCRSDNLEHKSGLRSPIKIMRSERLGRFHQTRLSFSRSLIRRIQREKWYLQCSKFKIDASNEGEALYTVYAAGKVYSFVAFAHHILPSERTDRAIAQHWDYTFVLCDGHLSVAEFDRLRRNVPLQDEGRFEAADIVFSRANKSARLFDNVVTLLANGRQPDLSDILEIGYLVRTTAVFANGKFGISDYQDLQLEKRGLSRCFEAQMLIVYLIREFSLDLVDHLSYQLKPNSAVRLSSEAQRLIGVGNATGLGMAPFIVDHPLLFDAWITTRELALERVITQLPASKEYFDRLVTLIERAARHLREWHTDDRRQTERNEVAIRELMKLSTMLAATGYLNSDRSLWDRIKTYGEGCDAETEEILVSVLIELGGGLVDDLEDALAPKEEDTLDANLTLEDIWNEIQGSYKWCLEYDFADPGQEHFFWYRSAFKSEPRLGIRGEDEGADLEFFIGVARDVAGVHASLSKIEVSERKGTTVARHLLSYPDHRAIFRRISSLRGREYAEVRDNLLAHDFMPIDLLRCKLAFFGATRFDPKSDRWVRVVLFHGVPRFAALSNAGVDADDVLFACKSS